MIQNILFPRIIDIVLQVLKIISLMQDQQSILQCPICSQQFAEQKRRPMILCMAQHTSCHQCVEKIFSKKNKDEIIDCPFRCGKIHYGSIQPFRYMKQIIETKLSLKKIGSTLKKQKVSFDTQKQKMIELLQKQREKNEWLIQLNSKKQNNIISESNKIIKEMLTTQIGRMEKNFTSVLKEMKMIGDKEIYKMFENKFTEYEQKNIKTNILIQEERKSKMMKLQKKIDQQMTIIKKVNESLRPLQKIQKNIVKNIQFQDSHMKAIKSLESDSLKIKQHLISIDEGLKQLKVQKSIDEEKKSVNEKIKIEQKKQVKVEKKLQAKRCSEPLNIANQMSPFAKKNPNNDKIYEVKKQQKKEQDLPPAKIVNYSERLKTQPNQPIQSPIFYRPISRQNSIGNLNNMRNTMVPLKKADYTLLVDKDLQIGSRTQRTQSYFTNSNKNKLHYKSSKDLVGNICLIEEKTAQQKKVDSIVKKIEYMFENTKVEGKSRFWKAKIDKYIHLSEEQIIDQLLRQLPYDRLNC